MNWKPGFLGALIFASMSLTSVSSFAGAADAEKNLHKLKVPEGFKVEVYAEVPGARQMALGSTGIVYVGTRGDKVYAVVDKDKDRKADQVVTMMNDLNIGNGVAMYEGNLYVAEQHRIARYAAPDFDLNLPFSQMRDVIYDKLPNKAHHGWRYIAFGPDKKLYVTVGAPCNICDVSGTEATIIRMNPDGTDAEIYAHGIRNSVGMDFHPVNGTLYFTDNNVDMMGDDTPAEELNAAPKKGMHFGFPYYAGGKDQHKDWKNKKAPQDVTFPALEFQAHSANLGFKFYSGKQFPAEYQGDAIVAQHGSWNRSSPVGYQLMRVTFDDKQQVTGQKVFIDGWLHEGEVWGRPTDVLQFPDGSLLVSDDLNGVIYRVSYGEPASATSTIAPKTNAATVAGLQMPESAIAHPDGRIFITEIGEFGKDGDGKVTVLHTDGKTETLASGLNDPKGIDLFDNQLYVADINQVVRIGLDGKQTVIARPADFPGKVVFLNDIEIDGTGTVYVSDSGNDDGKYAGIYQITPTGKVSEVLNDKSGIKRPNGLLMDGANKLLVADFGTGKLYQVALNESSRKKATVTELNRGFGGADGLVRDNDGFLYVSDWANGKVWQLSEPKATPQLITEGHQASADIALSADGRYILMPDMKAGELVFLPIR